MTIAVGFLTGDGAVLCADSQETISDYSKTTTQKIRTADFYGNWRLAIAGSSDAAHYIDLFQYDLVQRLSAAQDYDYVRIIGAIKATLHQIHKQHIWLRKDGRPVLQLLIGIQGMKPHHTRALLVSQEAVVLPVREYESIGVGAHMANAVKERMFSRNGLIYNGSAELAANYGIYILKHVKKSIVGCDGNTLVAIMKDGNLRWLTHEEVAEVEQAVEGFDQHQYQLRRALLDPAVDENGVANFSNSFASAMTTLKRTLVRGAEIRRKFEEHMRGTWFVDSQPPVVPAAAVADEPKPSTS